MSYADWVMKLKAKVHGEHMKAVQAEFDRLKKDIENGNDLGDIAPYPETKAMFLKDGIVLKQVQEGWVWSFREAPVYDDPNGK